MAKVLYYGQGAVDGLGNEDCVVAMDRVEGGLGRAFKDANCRGVFFGE